MSIKWRAKRNAAGDVIPNCWETDAGYTVAKCCTPDARFTVTRPGDKAPFAYTPDRGQVEAIIDADERALA